MKLQYFIFGLFFFFSICESRGNVSAAPSENPVPVKLLILLDKSASIKFSKDQTEKLPDELNRLLVYSVVNRSALGVYFINSVAMSKAYYKSTISLKEPQLNGGGLDNDQEMDHFKQQLRRERSNWKKKIKEALALKISGATTAETDLWGALSGIESFFKGQANKSLYIYSDMIHSTKALDHHKFPPKDEQQAREQAKKQLAGMMTKYNLKGRALAGIDIKVIFPGDAFSVNKNKVMEAYWRTIFESLGARNIVFE